MGRQVTCNDERRLFVIPSGDGYGCLGYDNCLGHVEQLSRLLDRPDLAPRDDEVGTLKQYADYGTLVAFLHTSKKDIGTYFDPGTTVEVRKVLEQARKEGTRITLTLGDRETGTPWADDPETGTVGRTTGPMKSPILLARSNSSGGEIIMSSCVLRIQDARTGRSLYVHPGPAPEPASPGMGR